MATLKKILLCSENNPSFGIMVKKSPLHYSAPSILDMQPFPTYTNRMTYEYDNCLLKILI